MRTARFIVPILAIACLALVGCKKKPKADSKDKAAAMDTDGMDTDGMDMDADDMAAATPTDGFPKLACDKTKPFRLKQIKRDAKGRAIHCYLTKPMMLDGVKCRPGGYYTTLYPSGKLKECTLDKGASAKIGAIKCGPGGIKLYPDGKVKECVFNEKTRVVNGVTCKWRAEYHKNGRLMRCNSGAAWTTGKVTIGADSYINLTDKGVLRVASMTKNPYAFKGHKCTYSFFYPSGKLKTCEINKKIKINGKETPLKVTLCFTEKGKRAKKVDGGHYCGDLKKAIKKLKKLAKKLKK